MHHRLDKLDQRWLGMVGNRHLVDVRSVVIGSRHFRDKAGAAVTLRHVVRMVAEIRPTDRRGSRLGMGGEAVREARLAGVGWVANRFEATIVRGLTIHRLGRLLRGSSRVVSTTLCRRHGVRKTRESNFCSERRDEADKTCRGRKLNLYYEVEKVSGWL